MEQLQGKAPGSAAPVTPGSARFPPGHVGVSVLCPGWVNTAILESDRNWPEHLGEVPTAEAANAASWVPFRQMAEAAVRGGMPPDEVARLVFDAVRANRFWILTHPDMAPAALQRMTRAVSGEQPGLGLR